MKANVDVSAVMQTVRQQFLEQQLTSEGISSILQKYSKDGYEHEAYLSHQQQQAMQNPDQLQTWQL